MKKSLLIAAALFAAFTINAKEIVIDLSTAEEMAYTDCSATPTVVEDVLNVEYMTSAGWLWAGIEFPLEDLTSVSNIHFEYKGKGEGVVLYAYLRDAEGNRWTKDDFWPSLEEIEWTEIDMLPDAPHWDNPEYDFGDQPFTRLGFIANPGTATSSSFALRNVKLTVDDETAVSNIEAQSKTTKVIRDGQMVILRDGKTYNALGTQLK